MFLYILRHGEAKSESEDPNRSLTARGREEVTAVCRAFSKIAPRVDAIWHSGKTRAEQTAAILAASLRIEGRVQSRNGLNPNDPLPPLVEELAHQEANLAIVGHLPQLGKLISVLLVETERNLIDLPAAGLVCLEREIDSWQLTWFLTPELC
ncbi:MAG: phosphohistidine phosphatase SixA [Spirochaetaceae bacterium]|nr:MAG: phosphohistidine phosphatase SixA [Spirochaetaceae bacterium]